MEVQVAPAFVSPAADHRRPEPIVWPFRELIRADEHYDRQLLMSHLCAYRLAATVGRGRRVLEVGCGSGYGAYYLAHAAARAGRSGSSSGPILSTGPWTAGCWGCPRRRSTSSARSR